MIMCMPCTSVAMKIMMTFPQLKNVKYSVAPPHPSSPAFKATRRWLRSDDAEPNIAKSEVVLSSGAQAFPASRMFAIDR